MPSMTPAVRAVAAAALLLTAARCSTTTPTDPSALVTVSAPRVLSLTVTGPSGLSQRGETAQLHALANLSNGLTEDRSTLAQWQSTNNDVLSVNSAGVLTAGSEGDASVRASYQGQTASLDVRVRYAGRTPDPAPGQSLALPANAQALITQFANERPDLLGQSCPIGLKYVNNPWLDYMVDRLRVVDTRWGYNAKPTRTAADNSGVPVVAAGDELAYNFSSDPDQGTTKVHLVDILEGHCGSTPRLTFRVFTGEEPGRWTSAGRF
jgi:hypothetical protein